MSTAPADLEAATSVATERMRTQISPLVVGGILLAALAHIPVLWTYLRSLYSLPHYGYILTLPVFAGVLAFGRVRNLGDLYPGNRWVALGWFLPSLFLLMISSVFDSPWLGGISSIWAMLAVAYAVGGATLVFALLPSWLMLCLAIRLPLLLDEQLVQVLQSVAARRASDILHYIGQAHILDGNVVETPVKRYLVEEACSGVQSLFAITACTIFYILWTQMAWWRSILIFIVCWFWVWTANVARIVSVTYFNSTYGWSVDEGWMHDALGVALFILTLLLIVSSAHLIWFFLPYGIFGGRDGTEESADESRKPQGAPTHFASLRRSIFASPAFHLTYALLLLFVWLPQWRVPQATASPVQLALLNREFAPAFAGWALEPGDRGFKADSRRDDSQWGARSQVWHYRKDSKEITVSLDYPFLGWHDLTTCYAVDGWTIDKRLAEPVPRSERAMHVIGPEERFVKTSMRRPEKNDYGYVVYQCFNDRQVPIPVPEFNLFHMLGMRLKAYKQRLMTLGASGSGMNDQVRSYQLQVMLQDHGRPLPQDEADVVKVFQEFRIRLHDKLSASPAGGAP